MTKTVFNEKEFLYGMITSLTGCGSLDVKHAFDILNDIGDFNLYDDYFGELDYEVKYESENIDVVAVLYNLIKNTALNEIEDNLEETIEMYLEDKKKEKMEKNKDNENDNENKDDILDDEEIDLFEDEKDELMSEFENARDEIYVYGNYMATDYDCCSGLAEFLEKIKYREYNKNKMSNVVKWFLTEIGC